MGDGINIITDFFGSSGAELGGTLNDPLNSSVGNVVVIDVRSNVENAVIFVNGTNTGNVTPAQLEVKKDDVIRNPILVTLDKVGYNSNIEYRIYAVSDTDINVIDSSVYDRLLNVNGIYINVEKYIDGNRVEYLPNFLDGVISLFFDLPVLVVDDASVFDLVVYFSGVDGSVVFNVNNDGVIYPVLGKSEYSYKRGDVISIGSSNEQQYVISKITLVPINGTPDVIEGDGVKSILAELVVDGDYELYIESKIVSVVAVSKPEIEIVSVPVKSISLNGNAEIPLIIRKNELVSAISVLTKTGIVEFDNLGDGEVVSIMIPNTLFDSVGNGIMYVYPVSLYEYYGGQGGKQMSSNRLNVGSNDFVTVENSNVVERTTNQVIDVYDADIVLNVPNSRTVVNRSGGLRDNGGVAKIE